MKRVNLCKTSPSVDQLLAMASKKPVLLVARNGATFVLEGSGEFEQEVAELGNSAKFMAFLKARSNQKGVTSIEQFARDIAGKHVKASRSKAKSLATAGGQKKNAGRLATLGGTEKQLRPIRRRRSDE